MTGPTPIDLPEGPALRLPAARPLAGLIFLPLWLVGWCIGGYFGIGAYLAFPQSATAVFLAFWALALLLALAALAWMLFGAECVAAPSGDLYLARTVLGLRWARVFPATQVTALAPAPRPPRPRRRGALPPWGFANDRGGVGFRVAGRPHSFGEALTPDQVDQVLAWLAPRLRTLP